MICNTIETIMKYNSAKNAKKHKNNNKMQEKRRI